MLDRPASGKLVAPVAEVAPVSFKILGGGAVTQDLYLPALALMGRLDRVTVVDAERGRLAEWPRGPAAAARMVVADYRCWLAADSHRPTEADCLIVALPNELHADATRRALNAGWHVLAEKPLALDPQECAHLAEQADGCGRLLRVAMSRRYLASLRLARDIVRDCELGPVVAIEVDDRLPFSWQPRSLAFFSRQAGGILADMGVHYLDYIETLVGPLTPISYEDDARGGVEASASYRLRAGNVEVALRLSRLDGASGLMRIMCARGEVLVEKTREAEVVVRPRGTPERRITVGRPFSDASWPASYAGSFAEMLCDLERAISGAATALADARDAARTAELIGWAYGRRAAPAPPRGNGLRTCDPPRVLVTGGTGFIGGHVVERLAAQGEAVRVMVRSPGRCANVARFPVELQHADVLDREGVREAVAGCRTVLHLACGRDEVNAARITIEGTRNVVEAAIAEGVDCVVVLSTMYVFGFPGGPGPVDERFPYRPYGGIYGRSKAKMERWCLARARSSGATRIVVLNPTCVIGPGGGAYTALPAALAARGQLCWIDGGRGRANYVYVQNLVDAVLAAAQVRDAHGQRFIISDGAVTWRELLGPTIDALALEVPDLTLDGLRHATRGQFRLADLVCAAAAAPEVRAVLKRSAWARQAHALWRRSRAGQADGGNTTTGAARRRRSEVKHEPPAWLADLYGPGQTRFSAARAQEVLGWTPRVDLAAAQGACLAWLRESGHIPACQDAGGR